MSTSKFAVMNPMKSAKGSMSYAAGKSSHLEIATKYLKSVFDPEGQGPQWYPNLDFTPAHLKSVRIEHNEVAKTTTGLFLVTLGSQGPRVRWYLQNVSGAGAPVGAFVFYKEVYINQDLATSFLSARPTAGIFKFQSASIAAGVFALSGVCYAISVQDLPDIALDITIDNFTSFRKNDLDVCDAKVEEGIVALWQPTGINKFKTPIQTGVTAANPLAYISDLDEIITVEDNGIFIDTNWAPTGYPSGGYNAPTNIFVNNAFGRVKVEVFVTPAAGGSLIVEVNRTSISADGTTVTNNVSSVLVTVVNVPEYVVLEDPATNDYLGPVTGINISSPNTLVFNSSLCFLRVTYYDRNNDGYVDPSNVILYAGVTAGQQILLSGQVNLECVPNQTLAPNVTVQDRPFSNEFDFLSSMLSRRNDYKFPFVMPYGFWKSNHIAEQITEPMVASGFTDLLKSVAGFAPMIGSIIGGPIGGALGGAATDLAGSLFSKGNMSYRKRFSMGAIDYEDNPATESEESEDELPENTPLDHDSEGREAEGGYSSGSTHHVPPDDDPRWSYDLGEWFKIQDSVWTQVQAVRGVPVPVGNRSRRCSGKLTSAQCQLCLLNFAQFPDEKYECCPSCTPRSRPKSQEYKVEKVTFVKMESETEYQNQKTEANAAIALMQSLLFKNNSTHQSLNARGQRKRGKVPGVRRSLGSLEDEAALIQDAKNEMIPLSTEPLDGEDALSDMEFVGKSSSANAGSFGEERLKNFTKSQDVVGTWAFFPVVDSAGENPELCVLLFKAGLHSVIGCPTKRVCANVPIGGREAGEVIVVLSLGKGLTSVDDVFMYELCLATLFSGNTEGSFYIEPEVEDPNSPEIGGLSVGLAAYMSAAGLSNPHTAYSGGLISKNSSEGRYPDVLPIAAYEAKAKMCKTAEMWFVTPLAGMVSFIACTRSFEPKELTVMPIASLEHALLMSTRSQTRPGISPPLYNPQVRVIKNAVNENEYEEIEQLVKVRAKGANSLPSGGQAISGAASIEIEPSVITSVRTVKKENTKGELKRVREKEKKIVKLSVSPNEVIGYLTQAARKEPTKFNIGGVNFAFGSIISKKGGGKLGVSEDDAVKFESWKRNIETMLTRGNLSGLKTQINEMLMSANALYMSSERVDEQLKSQPSTSSGVSVVTLRGPRLMAKLPKGKMGQSTQAKPKTRVLTQPLQVELTEVRPALPEDFDIEGALG